jgi:hypothetical protein
MRFKMSLSFSFDRIEAASARAALQNHRVAVDGRAQARLGTMKISCCYSNHI